MNDYIRREDALNSIDTHNKFIKEDIRTLAKEYYEYKGGVDYAYEKIKHDVPAADVVEVVRCKDCKKRYTWECPCCYYYKASDDWFCGSGEPPEKTEEKPTTMPDTDEEW